MTEIWKPIPGFPSYEVSDIGQVRSIKHPKAPRVLSPSSYRGYLGVTLCDNGKRMHVRIHRLVMLAFVGPEPDNAEVCHNDDDPSNNRLVNLRYDTHSANMQDSVRNGNRSLSVEKVRQIRQERLNNIPPKKIAKKYNISVGQVYDASLGITYGYIDGSIRAREISDKRARSIREEYAKGGASYSKLAKKYEVDQSHVSRIVNGKLCATAGGPIKGKDY